MLSAVFAVVARGAATPVTPAPGAKVTSGRPLFAWGLPSNETSAGIFVSRRPETTPEGQFHTDNVVTSEVFTTNRHVWSPTTPLYAGDYWWNVWSHDRDSDASHYSAPSPFTIPVVSTLWFPSFRRYRSRRALTFGVRWTANVQRPLVTARITRRGRTVWKRRSREYGTAGTTDFTWVNRRVRKGARVTVRLGVTANGVVHTRAVTVTAP
jgi:hypothetical protein